MTDDPRAVLRSAGEATRASLDFSAIRRRAQRRARRRRAWTATVSAVLPLVVLGGLGWAGLQEPRAPEAALPPSAPAIAASAATPSAAPAPPSPPAAPTPTPATPADPTPAHEAPAVSDDATTAVEAEHGRLSGAMGPSDDPGAWNDSYVSVEGDSADGWVEFSFEVLPGVAHGTWARVMAPGNGSDSFWMSVDGGPDVIWRLPGPQHGVPEGTWFWAPLADPHGLDPTATLTPGVHRLRLSNREAGSRLDALRFVNGPQRATSPLP